MIHPLLIFKLIPSASHVNSKSRIYLGSASFSIIAITLLQGIISQLESCKSLSGFTGTITPLQFTFYTAAKVTLKHEVEDFLLLLQILPNGSRIKSTPSNGLHGLMQLESFLPTLLCATLPFAHYSLGLFSLIQKSFIVYRLCTV